MRKFIAAALLLAATLHAQTIRPNAAFRANSVPRNDDGSSPLVPIGFNVNFFGRTRTHTYVNNNGNITFDAALATFTPFGLVNTQREIIAAFQATVKSHARHSSTRQSWRRIVQRPRIEAKQRRTTWVDVGSARSDSAAAPANRPTLQRIVCPLCGDTRKP